MMNQVYSCTYFNHLDEPIQGFCLCLDCKSPQSQFCLKCFEESQDHSTHKQSCKTFKEIEDLINYSIIYLTDQQKQLQKEYDDVRVICERALKEFEAKKNKLKHINLMLTEQNYFELKENITLLKQLFLGDKITSSKISLNSENFQIANELTQNQLLIKALEEIKYQFATYEISSLIQTDRAKDIQSLQISESNLNKCFETGLILIKQRDWKQAYEVFSTCLQQSTKDPRFIFYQSWILNELNKCSQSQKFLEQALLNNQNLYTDLHQWVGTKLEEQTQNIIFLITKACALYEIGGNDKALSLFDAAILIDNKHTISYLYKGLILSKQKKIEQAFVCFELACNMNFNTALIHYQKGVLLLDQKRLEEALQSLKFSIQFDPSFSEAYFLIGNILRLMKKSEEAHQYYNHAIDFDQQLKYYVSKGSSLLEVNKPFEALICFEQVLSIDSNFQQAMIMKGNALKKLKKFTEALNSFDEALKLAPNSAIVYMYKGLTLQQLKLRKEALQCFESALKIDPNNIQFYFHKCNILRELKQYNDAVQCINQAILLQPENAEVYNVKGIVLEEQNKFMEAIQCFQIAIRLGHPEQKKIKDWISNISAKSGISNIFRLGRK